MERGKRADKAAVEKVAITILASSIDDSIHNAEHCKDDIEFAFVMTTMQGRNVVTGKDENRCRERIRRYWCNPW